MVDYVSYQLQIHSPDGGTRVVKCTAQTLTIGSGADASLIINDKTIAPKHLRVEFHPSQVYVTALDGTTGAEQYDSVRQRWQPLLSNQKKLWQPDTMVRVGRHILLLTQSMRIATAGSNHTIGARRLVPAAYEKINSSIANAFHRQFERMPFLQGVKTGYPFAQPRWAGLPATLFVNLWKFAVIASFMIIIFVSLSTLIFASLSALDERIAGLLLRAPTATPTVTLSPRTPQPPLSATATLPLVVVLPSLTPSPLPSATATPTRADFVGVIATPMPINAQLDEPAPLRINRVDGPSAPTATATQTPVLTPPTLTPTPTIPPLPTVTVEAALQQLGVTVARATVPVGQDYWQLTAAHWLNEEEAHGRNYILIEVLDKAGQRVLDQPLTIQWRDGSTTLRTNKPQPEDHAFNYLLSASGNAYSVKLEGLPSDVVQGLGMGTVEKPLAYSLTGFRLTFQRTTRQP